METQKDAVNTEASSGKLTPQEIKNKDFKRAMWGFSAGEVVDFLAQVSKSIEKMQRHEKELTDRVKFLGEELTRWKNKELEMQKLREKAVQDAEAIRAEAGREAQRAFAGVEERAKNIRQQTEEWLEKVIAEVEETERQRANFVAAFKSALDSHYVLLQNESEGAQPLGTKLNQFLRGAMESSERMQ